MPGFKVLWDDFTGGYFVGENDERQPKNTFTGYNVTTTMQDGAVVPTNEITQLYFDASRSTVAENIAYDNRSIYISDAYGEYGDVNVGKPIQAQSSIYFTVGGYSGGSAIRMIQVALNSVPGTSPAVTNPASSFFIVSAPFGVYNSSGISNVISDGTHIYVASGTIIYKFSYGNISFAPTTISTPMSTAITGLTIWNDRMIAWSNSSNTFVFSEANNFTSWPTLNYITIGTENTGIEFITPRYDDLLIVHNDAVYSLTGVLSVNASLRKVSEQLNHGDHRKGMAVQQSNAIFFISQLLSPYYANINVLSGQQFSTIAYSSFGRNEHNPTIAATINGDVVQCSPMGEGGIDGFSSLVRNRTGDWIKLQRSSMDFYATSSADKVNFRRWYTAVNNKFPSIADEYIQNESIIYFMQVAERQSTVSGITRTAHASVSFGAWTPRQLNAGTTMVNTKYVTPPTTPEVATAVSGTLRLPTIGSETPSKIVRVYVEAELSLDAYAEGDMGGSATMTASVVNGAVDDYTFDTTATFVASNKVFTTDLQTINGLAPYALYNNPDYTRATPLPLSPNDPRKRVLASRVLRFDTNDTGYGYKHNVLITFSGYKIKRVWVEGESR